MTAHRRLAVDLLRRCVSVETTNPPGAEAPLAQLLADELERGGLDTRLIEHGDARSSVLARLRGGRDRCSCSPATSTPSRPATVGRVIPSAPKCRASCSTGGAPAT